jgi:hypothetical protein
MPAVHERAISGLDKEFDAVPLRGPAEPDGDTRRYPLGKFLTASVNGLLGLPSGSLAYISFHAMLNTSSLLDRQTAKLTRLTAPPHSYHPIGSFSRQMPTSKFPVSLTPARLGYWFTCR